MREVEVKQKEQKKFSGLLPYVLMMLLFTAHWIVVNLVMEWVTGLKIWDSKLYFIGIILMFMGLSIAWVKVLHSKYKRSFWPAYMALMGVVVVSTFVLRYAVREYGFDEMVPVLIFYILLHTTTLGADLAFISVHTDVFDE